MKPIIELIKIGKSYKLHHSAATNNIREHLVNLVTTGRKTEIFWSLKDIDLEIMPGDAIGILGRNGAGKSTLLKVLSRITPPTCGHAIVRGNMAGLLEAGAGLHPELSGRENIWLNGSLLGMKRNEIRAAFDSIIAFGEVEKFLDTALKHYSDGMQLRLAFSVSAHLQPDIFLLDEVFAVGDLSFQQKCLDLIKTATKSGRTMLFVSHNLENMRSFCQKGIVLHEGRMVFSGNIEEAIIFYTKNLV